MRSEVGWREWWEGGEQNEVPSIRSRISICTYILHSMVALIQYYLKVNLYFILYFWTLKLLHIFPFFTGKVMLKHVLFECQTHCKFFPWVYFPLKVSMVFNLHYHFKEAIKNLGAFEVLLFFMKLRF